MTTPYSEPGANGPAARPDFASLDTADKGFLVAGGVTFIASFLPFAHFSYGGFGDSISAWHGVGALAGLLSLLALVAGAARIFAASSLPDLPVSPRLIAEGLAALALLFFLIRWLSLPGGDVLGKHYGYGLYWGGFVVLIANVVQLVFGAMGLRDSGETMPWQQGTSPTV